MQMVGCYPSRPHSVAVKYTDYASTKYDTTRRIGKA